jgi:hypothetical protein
MNECELQTPIQISTILHHRLLDHASLIRVVSTTESDLRFQEESTMSARLAARFGCDRPVACLAAGGAGGGGGFPAVARLPVGLVEGARGGAFRPVPVGGAPPIVNK